MKTLRLDSMTVDELWDLHEKISQLLSARIIEDKRQLERRLEQLKKTHSEATDAISVRQHGEPAPRRFYPKVHAKYQNPQVLEETWSGRGKQPKWLVKALSEGRRMEDFLIGATDNQESHGDRKSQLQGAQ